MEIELILTIAFACVFPILLGLAIYRVFLSKRQHKPLEIDQRELQAAEREMVAEGNKDWVVLKRCHGPAYNHAAMTELVSQLTTQGVESTYDVISASSAEGGVTNYILKVLRGSETQAIEILSGRND